MDTRQTTNERISALLDGEAGEAEIELALAALKGEEGRARWAAYHAVGDALHSDDLNIPLSEDFMSRFSARLEAEPTILAPAAAPVRESRLRRLAMPGAAVAAAVAAVALVLPQQPEAPQALVASASAVKSMPATLPAAGGALLASTNASVPRMQVLADGKTQIQMLRDPQIDQYLMAHQRVSPSFYSATQVVRPAPVEVSVDK